MTNQEILNRYCYHMNRQKFKMDSQEVKEREAIARTAMFFGASEVEIRIGIKEARKQ